MTKQEHIDAVEQVIWDWLQSHYQESCYTTELGKFTDALCDFWKIYNDNKSEINTLKAENEKLEEDIDMIIKEQKDDYRFDIIQAKIDVLNELKTRHDYAIKNMGYPWDISQQIDKLIEEIENNGR